MRRMLEGGPLRGSRKVDVYLLCSFSYKFFIL